MLPGWGGGSSWPGAAVDVEDGILFVPSLTLPIVASLAPGDPGDTNPDYVRVGNIYPPGPRGLPLVKPLSRWSGACLACWVSRSAWRCRRWVLVSKVAAREMFLGNEFEEESGPGFSNP